MGEYLTRLLRNVEYQIKFLDGLISENHHFTSIRPSITNVSMVLSIMFGLGIELSL